MTLTSREQQLAALAGAQHGVVAARQLVALGWSRTAIFERVTAGRLHAVHRGVYAHGHASLSRHGSMMAAVLAFAGPAAIARTTAAELWGITRIRDPRIHVLSSQTRARRSGVVTHTSRSVHPAELTTCHGIPVTTVARTLIDLADDLSAHQVASLMHEAAYRRRLNLRALQAAITRHRNRHGRSTLAAALDLHLNGSAGTRSLLEDRFLAHLRNAAVLEPLVNHRIEVRDGSIEVDFAWPDKRLCVELDGIGHRRTRSRQQDAVRGERLRDAGFQVMRVDGCGDLARAARQIRGRLVRR